MQGNLRDGRACGDQCSRLGHWVPRPNVWATGYQARTDWVAIPEALDTDGQFVHHRGVSPVPGLYFVGRPWQWTQGSSRLFGVGQDAAYVVNQIDKRLGEGYTSTAVPRRVTWRSA
jgi:putative flavoprotein involved in K+ transport